MRSPASFVTLVVLLGTIGRAGAPHRRRLTRTPSRGIPTRSWPAWADTGSAAPTATARTVAACAAPTSRRSGRRAAPTQGLFKTIRSGVSGTEMPAFVAPRTSDREIWQMLAYLRTLAAPAPLDPPRGNAENGARVFRKQCASCHRVNAIGGRIGPDLSRIGSARSRDVLVARIRRGAETFRPGFAPVTVTPESGPPIQGVKKNEDLFSVQIMDTRERIQGYEKDKVKSVVEWDEIGDADLRSRSPERQRSRRSRPLPADAARVRPDVRR